MIVTAGSTDTLPTDLVLVAGCFDPLHAGHLAYFDAAAAFGPVCCAVATDDQIRRLKGRPPLLPQGTRMAILDAIEAVDFVVAQDDSGDAGVLEDLRPAFYAKGKDWLDRLPDAEMKACAQFGIPALFLETGVTDSSGAVLGNYQRALDDQYAERFRTWVARQLPAVTRWRPVTDYQFEARRQIEGIHPQLIKDVFQPNVVLDVGCGPEAILVRLLAELGVDATGVDAQAAGATVWSPGFSFPGDIVSMNFYAVRSDLVLCREVLEHLTVKEIRLAVRHLVRLSSKYVYVTTRFCPDPAHLLDFRDHDDLDPTHISLLNKSFLRLLFELEGCTSRFDLEARMDHKHLGRCLVFEVA